jgi:LPS sulfotransferase NodH
MTANSPFFLIGVARSGTTLLSLMLDSHSRIAIPYESHFIVPYYRDRQRWSDLHDPARRIELVTSILREPAVRHWDQQLQLDEIDLDRCTSLAGTVEAVFSAYARRCGKEIWGDKTPSYTAEIHILNKLFPNARFVHIIRDGRDVARSLVEQWWGPNDFMTALRYWSETVSCARKMLQMLPEDRFVEVKFEDLVADPVREVRKVTDLLGVAFEPDMVNRYTAKAREKVGEHANRHHVHLSERPSPKQAFKWREALTPADQAVAHEIAGPVLAELGYPAGTTHHPFKLLRKGYHRLRESYEWRFNTKRRLQQAADWGFGGSR